MFDPQRLSGYICENWTVHEYKHFATSYEYLLLFHVKYVTPKVLTEFPSTSLYLYYRLTLFHLYVFTLSASPIVFHYIPFEEQEKKKVERRKKNTFTAFFSIQIS